MATDGDDEPRRKRKRIGYACDYCRAKKNRCDGERPVCGSCRERGQSCRYPPTKSRPVYTEEYVENLKAQNRLLEDQLQRGAARGDQEPSQAHAGLTARSDYGMSPPQDWRSTEPGSMQPGFSQNGYRGPVRHSVSFERRPSALQTSGHSNGAGLVSPSASTTVAPEAASTHSVPLASTPSENGNSRNAKAYYGESSTFNFLEKVCSPAEEDGASGSAANGGAMNYASSSLAASQKSANPYDGLLSGAGDDPFGLPHRSIADSLVDSYFKHRHPTNPYLHEPRFRQRYERVWLGQAIGGESATENTLAWLGLVNMVFAFGYDHDSDGRNSASVGRVRYFKRAQTLLFSGMLHSGTVELVQALLLMGQYYHNGLELNTCWTIVGMAIRVAQGLGLHICPGSSSYDPIDREVRKRTWWGCYIQDRLLSVKVGRRPTIDEIIPKTCDLPLAVDDDYISAEPGAAEPPIQPADTPSRLSFYQQAILQARFLGQVVDTLYSGTSPPGKEREPFNVSDLVARSIKLDGDLVSWQQGLPPHLQFDAEGGGWLFERQRSVLLMRFLGARQLIHRQILLIVISRRIEDPFQNELVHLCVGRCVAASYDTICQMAILQQRALMRSGWHNSHYVFTALCILVAFQTLDPESRAQARLPESIDVSSVISRGMDILERAGELHPLAIRYLDFVRQWQTRLQNISTRRQTSSATHIAAPGSMSNILNAQGMETSGQPPADHFPPNQFPLDVGTGFFDIENLFDPSTWFEMPYNLNENAAAR
ncbi:hypothetical protein NA57DRAFT_55880 [Rhizodiscina lignyota]|uniref:Zn(2)-C6 fungal-type domain-containing protein n=1 Tax=Rhizodiscina lignyota TaxID=1504668 RepID=A0A9P4IH75_9PEZI|nr:hypothetical protein NA57DRAFT_55880 [Rhizodiscina lignyota]